MNSRNEQMFKKKKSSLKQYADVFNILQLNKPLGIDLPIMDHTPVMAMKLVGKGQTQRLCLL